MAARTSCTHCGHRESVSRGQPSFGKARSWLRRSGAGAHLGWKGRGGLAFAFQYWNTGHTASADLLRAVSNALTLRASIMNLERLSPFATWVAYVTTRAAKRLRDEPRPVRARARSSTPRDRS